MSDDTTSPVLATLAETFKERFDNNKRILTYPEYLDYAFNDLSLSCRDAASYVRDCFDYYGSYTVDRPWGQERRWALFDTPFDEGRDNLVGQEAAQDELYTFLCGFAQERRVDRLIVLNGPNGSAKTTLVTALMRALEAYSATDEGALYTINWVFPSRTTLSRIGFQGTGVKVENAESFAHLLDEDVDARLRCEVRDHPLLVLPSLDRMGLLEGEASRRGVELPKMAEILSRGGMCHNCKLVFDALVSAYHGDLARVLQHVQVERWFISRSYRRGAVTIGPQLSVDAGERQISADRSLSSLPSSLQMTTLFEPHGELVDAEGGILEFSDLLKRPLDAFKYLLATIETGEVSLNQSILRLNAVLLATTNDQHLAAFREHPEFTSFRGRIAVVRVPYLRDYPTEQQIYDTRVVPNIHRHVSPHATETAARWAVLTRLRRPDPKEFDEKVRETVKDLTAPQKGELYATGKVPEELKGHAIEELRGIIGDLYHETDTDIEYEGRYGASPREIRAILFAAAQDDQSKCVSPSVVLKHIQALCDQQADHAFLQRKSQSGNFEGAEELVEDVRNQILDAVEDELRTATGLVAEERHLELFERYVLNVRHWVKGEKLYNKVTGKDEDPDDSVMTQVEERLDIPSEDVEDFRKAIISAIAGYAIERPGESIELPTIFPDHLSTLRGSYFSEHSHRVAKVGRDILALLHGDRITPSEDHEVAQTSLETLRDRFGYCDSCAAEALTDLVKLRYDKD